ncbi:hypothetical protein BLNAU_2977 [Blattamonas nauphoetae]|uniref:Uncharacterized protein n=1 Tax=Blattamonas nauphoetae TaxID=2049346 RepID=A0ABQ9YDR4_9EUKA|nr:hypothetical protein BLNAU_2977 [Blattamonas nauphoetae]
MLEQAHLEGEEISLPTSTTSDWRLILQDSITTDDLRQGCLSLFEQVNSERKLAPKEVFHAVRFLEYATIHIEHREYPHNKLLEAIFPKEEHCQTKLTSTLIKLVSHSSATLQTAALSFFAVGSSKSTKKFYLAVATTELLPQLFEHLKPHSIPIHKATIDFHRHITSIVDDIFVCSPNEILRNLDIKTFIYPTKTLISEIIKPIFQPLFNYLRYLLANRVSATDYPSGISLLSKMHIYRDTIGYSHDDSSHLKLEPFFEKLRKKMLAEMTSSFGLATADGTLRQILFGDWRRMDGLHWVEIFETILDRLSEGQHFSDLGLEVFLLFMSHRPLKVSLVFGPNGTFSIEDDNQIVSSMERPSTSLCALLAPTRPDHAASILAHIRSFTIHVTPPTLLRDIKSGWFAAVFATFVPSKLPFTNEYRSFHTSLIYTIKDYLFFIFLIAGWSEQARSRSELDEICHSFQEQTGDYIVHLSLHPFALISKDNTNTIIDFFTHFFRHDENSVLDPFRDEVRKTIDAPAISSSSPPFILTSEFICDLTDEEIMNVVDRIVALLDSDSCLDDDTILRICAFHTNQLKCVYLPELFRMAGRTTEHYFHTLNTHLSLPLDCFDLHPVSSLLKPKPHSLQPTFDQWDDVDLSTVGVVLRSIDENRLSFNSAISQLLQFTVDVLPQMSHCASRLNLSQLERLLSPSIDFLFKLFLINLLPSDYKFRRDRETAYIELSRLCEQRVIAQCLSRIGFFSRIVGGLLDDSLFFEYQSVIDIFLNQARYSGDETPEWKTLQRTVHLFLEEGWQDVLDFLVVRKKYSFHVKNRIKHAKDMMGLHGANFCEDSNSDDSDSDDTDSDDTD